MNTGIIYLVQPAELIGTERFKFGCSENTELDRVKKGYKKGTRYLNIMECKNPYDLEKKIKNIFNEKFKKIAGNEYFEGNETDMLNEFIKVANDHRKNIDTNDKMDDIICDSCNGLDKIYLCDHICGDCDDCDGRIELSYNASINNHGYISDNEEKIREIKEINKIFENYKEDYNFGGKKYLIKITINYYNEYSCVIVIIYIND